ncbi:MAG: hypothetical protein J7K17_02725, partial [Candidatus Omnitrophica bacterium]|nr:hypothetical protein [Candidatus Omnitrophota bacterium]
MNKAKRDVVITLIFLAFVTLAKAYAEEVNLPQKDKKIYGSLNTRLYELKVKLKPKIVEEKVYWQNKKEVNWKEEIKKWNFGFLPEDEFLPPLVTYEENFYPEEEDFQTRDRWMSNNGKILIINFLKVPIKGDIRIEATSYKKKRDLEVWINGVKKEVFEIPSSREENKFFKFNIKNVVLKPGKNFILFFTPQDTDILYRKWSNKKREVSIKFKDSFRFFVKEKLSSLEENFYNFPIYKYIVSRNSLNLFIDFRENKGEERKPLLLSKKINIDIEEFPYLDLDFHFGKSGISLFLFLGIDFNEDGRIDDYLVLQPADIEDINLFEMAKKMWPQINYFEHKFKIKKIILMFEFENNLEGITLFNLKNINFYNSNSLVLIGKNIKKEELEFKEKNVAYTVMDEKGKFNIISYFDGAPIERSNKLKEAEERKNREKEEVNICIPLDKSIYKKFPHFSFFYNIENPQIQEIRIFLLLQDKEGRKNLVLLDKVTSSKGKIEVNLENLLFEKTFEMKKIIIKLKRKDDVDCSIK